MGMLSAADCEIDIGCYEHPEEFLEQLMRLQRLPVIQPSMRITAESHWESIKVIGHGSLNAAGCPNVVKVHDWLNLGTRPALSRESDSDSDSEEQRLEYYFRILYDYYPGGSIDALFDDYFQNEILLPEAFLWHLFHCMMTAVLYCTNGHAKPYIKPGWEEIVHKDVKPSNSLAYTLPNDDVREYKKSFCMEGTGEYTPPVRHIHLKPLLVARLYLCSQGTMQEARDIYAPWEISSKIDVYALSHTIQNASKKVYQVYTGLEHQLIIERSDADHYLPYSVTLHELCERCHSSDPEDRPDVYKLWEVTSHMAREWKRVVLNNRRDAEVAGERFYEGMVLFDKNLRNQVFADQALRNEYFAATSWKHRNQQAVAEMKKWARWRQMELYGRTF
ncbi:predicted protein [Uncinocarpus reesii 1704]|uniref:non-specific serine/threonine protein kinase n=1 Tax=Uncinocarpus reesii (strain UAMH 1704) TaxID=336963 RepID=C4JWI8_UNCRE|nr:uncharacterized protein UREG_06930 [Uncinocarpus reesii 1704]EEP82065.1 predicted protein [Uncinocarpus reesii 1704]